METLQLQDSKKYDTEMVINYEMSNADVTSAQ